MIKSEKHGWYVYYNDAMDRKLFWEHEPEHSGLLLTECPICHSKQTRQNYAKGFFKNYYWLIQDYETTGIAQCANCNQWLKIHG